MRGIIYKEGTKQSYLVIGIKKLEDGTGFELEFISDDKNDPKGKIVEKIFVPKPMAITVAKKFLEK